MQDLLEGLQEHGDEHLQAASILGDAGADGSARAPCVVGYLKAVAHGIGSAAAGSSLQGTTMASSSAAALEPDHVVLLCSIPERLQPRARRARSIPDTSAHQDPPSTDGRRAAAPGPRRTSPLPTASHLLPPALPFLSAVALLQTLDMPPVACDWDYPVRSSSRSTPRE